MPRLMLARHLCVGNGVQLKITLSREAAVTLIRLDGWLTGESVEELERVLQQANPPRRLVTTDLRNADEAGLAVLRRLVLDGSSLEGLSAYMQLRMATAWSPNATALDISSLPETPVRSK